MLRRIMLALESLIPKVDDLPQCYRLTWIGREWLIRKDR